MTEPALAALARRGIAVGDATRGGTPELVASSALLVADTLACVVVGGGHPTVRRLLKSQCIGEESGPCGPLASPGSPCRLADAVVVDATAAHADEFDVVHPGSGTVPGAVTVPVAVHYSLRADVEGSVLLGAVAAGFEVTVAAALLLGGRQLYGRSWWPAAVAGRLGAAMAAAYVLGLGADRTLHALALSAASAGGLLTEDVFADGHYVLLGDVAAVGAQAAQRAGAGLRGSSTLLDEPAHRAFLTHTFRSIDQASTPYILEGMYKEFPCATPLQAVIRGLEALGGSALVAQSNGIEVAIPPAALSFVSANRVVDGPPEAAASLAYATGAVVRGRQRDVGFFRAADPASAYPGQLTLTSSDSPDVVNLTVTGPRGQHVERSEPLRSNAASQQVFEQKIASAFDQQDLQNRWTTVPAELAAGMRPGLLARRLHL